MRETILEQLKTDQRKAANLAWQVCDLNLRRELLLEIINQWICQEPMGAINWILKLPAADVGLSDELLCNAAETFASVDPLRSAEWLSRVRSDSHASESMLSVIQTWSAVRPEEVAKLVVQFPDGGLRLAAMDSVARDWMKKDPTTAYVWIKGLPEVDRLIAQLDQP